MRIIKISRIKHAIKINIEKAPFHYESDWQKYAIDFKIPVGTKIIAAQKGLAFQVIDNFDSGDGNKTNLESANLIIIKHKHNEYSCYAHLRKNCLIKEGQNVRKGDPIAFSDITGYCGYPHLHFCIMKNKENWITIPAQFKTENGIKILRSPKK